MAMNLGTAVATIDLNNAGFMSKLSQSQQGMNRLGASGAKGMAGFDDQVGRTTSRIGAMGTVATGVGTLIAAPFLIGVKGAADLEQGLKNIEASLGSAATPQIMGEIADETRRIGTESMYSAPEVAGLVDQLVKGGFDIQDVLGEKGAAGAVVDLAAATDTDLNTAITGVTQSMNTWKPGIVDAGIALEDSARAADILTVAANQSAGGVEDIIAGMRPLGPVAASMGIGFDESAAAIAVFTNNGMKGADAGISLARGLQNLADPTSEAAGLMTDLGISAFDSQGSFVGFPSLFGQLQGSMSGMSDQAQLTALSTIFGAEAMDVMGLAILNGAEPLEAMIGLMQEQGIASEQAATRMDTFWGSLDRAKESVMTLIASFMSGLLPAFTMAADAIGMIADVLMKIPGPIKTIIGALAGLTVAFAALTIGPQLLGSMFGAIGIGSGIFAGFGAALGAVIAPALAVAAVAGAIYLAWKTNFLGFRDLVTGVVDGVKGAFTGLKDLWDEVWSGLDGPTDFMDRINDIGGVTGEAAKYGNTFARVLATIGGVMRRLSGLPFLGWLDTLGTGFQKAGDFVEAFTDTWTSLNKTLRGMDEIEGIGGILDTTGRSFDIAGIALRSFGAGFRAIGLDGIASGFERLAGKVEGAGTVFRALREQGLNPLQAGFHTLMVTVPRFRAAIDALEPAWRPAIAAFNAFRDGDYAAGFRQVGQSIRELGSVLGQAAIAAGSWVLDIGVPAVTGWLADTAGDAWGALSSAAGWAWGGAQSVGSWALNVAAPVIGGWLADTAGNVWGALSTAAGWAWGVAQDVGAWTLNVAVPAVTGWLSDTAGNVWNALKTAAGWAGDVAGDIGAWILRVGAPRIESAIDIAVSIANWVREKISGINWSGVSDALITGFGEALRGAFGAGQSIGALIGGGIDIGGRILDWVAGQIEGINWGRAGEAVGRGLAAAIGGIGGMMTLGPGFLAGIISALGGVNWGEAASAFWRFFTAAFKANISFLGGLAEGISSAFLDAVSRVEWGNVLDTVIRVFGELPGKIGQAIADKGPDVLRGFMESIATGARAAWDGVSSLVGDVFMNLPADLMRAVAGKGADILSSFMQSIATGARAAWDAVSSLVGDVFRNLPADLARAVTSVDPTTILSSFMTSIATGARAAWDAVSSLIGDVFRNLPADLQRAVMSIDPTTILTSFMTSIATGARAAWDAVSSLVGDVFRNLPADLQRAVMSIDPTTILTSFMQSIASGARAAWDAVSAQVGDVFRNLPADLTRAVGDGGTILVDFMQSIATGARSAWDGVSGQIGDIFRNLPADLIRGVGSGADVLVTFITSIVSGAIAAWNGAIEPLKTIFSEVGDKLSSLIDLSAIETVFNGIVTVINGLTVPFDTAISKATELVGLLGGIGGGGNIGEPVTTLPDGTTINPTDPEFAGGPLDPAAQLPKVDPTVYAGTVEAAAGRIEEAFKRMSTALTDFNSGPMTTVNAGFQSHLGPTMAAFNAGPLTLLNAGFPILAATILAFNAGPLTTLNAAFPILTASMTAFNAGPLTTLNAGFPILAATILAFNAGPLTTLNAAFPILTASMNAFNYGPLTLLNAGFPILSATILAFNAGPLTTLNAAFPILTATMLAFNYGPLTMLNAGFPILAATILAFNAGPLTTLNAAFPILTASMMAFNYGPLTLLNAGFPILAATILAFNGGPLTVLNAAFPILTATMTAFNAGPLTTLNAGFPILGATILSFNAGPLTTLNAGFPIVGASAMALGATLGAVGGQITAFGATTSAMTQTVISGFSAMSGAVAGSMAALVGSVQSGMAAASAAVQSGAAQWPGIIAGMAGPMGSAGQSAGAAASAGVAAGLRSNIGAIRAASNEIISVVNETMRAAAKIASPSKLTAEIGRMLTAGVSGGMQAPAMLHDLGRSAARVVDTASAGMNLRGVYNDAARMLGREKGPMGGAILQGWERLTDGFWRRMDTGQIQKGIRAEDGSYVNPGFYKARDRMDWKLGTTVRDLDRTVRTLARTVPALSEATLRTMPRTERLDYRSQTTRDLSGIGNVASALRLINSGKWLESYGLKDLNYGPQRQVTDTLDRMLRTQRYASAQRGRQYTASTQAGQRPNTGTRGGSQTTTVTHVYQVVPQELERIMTNAEKGAEAHSGLSRFSGTRATTKVSR